MGSLFKCPGRGSTESKARVRQNLCLESTIFFHFAMRQRYCTRDHGPSLDASTTRCFLDIVLNDFKLSSFSPRPRKMPHTHNASSVSSQNDHVDTSIASSQNNLVWGGILSPYVDIDGKKVASTAENKHLIQLYCRMYYHQVFMINSIHLLQLKYLCVSYFGVA